MPFDEQLARKVALKLEGKLGKFTITVVWKDNTTCEFQCEENLLTEYDSTLREPVFREGYASDTTTIRWSEVKMIHVQENEPKP